MQSFAYYIKYPNKLAEGILIRFFQWLPDAIFIKLRFRIEMKKKLNLSNPETFQEKIQWLKLYNQNPIYRKMVDKLQAKEYVSKTIGEEYVIPLLGVWDNPDEINWDILPNSFVLKTNHGGGNTGVVICRDKNNFNFKDAISKLKLSLKDDVYRNSREWPYKDINKRVFVERLIETEPDVKDLPDYKWYCFDGEPKYCQVIQDRTTKETIDFFDTDWKHQEFTGLLPTRNSTIHKAVSIPAKPSDLELQIKIVKQLARGIPFVRIDLYSAKGKTYFGEITFFPMSGMGTFSPSQYNEILGNMIKLPSK